MRGVQAVIHPKGDFETSFDDTQRRTSIQVSTLCDSCSFSVNWIHCFPPRHRIRCDHCPKSFILKEALKQHVNRNHSENPVMELHKCPLCPKVCFKSIEIFVFCFHKRIIFSFSRSHFAIHPDSAVTCLFTPANHSSANTATNHSTIAVHWNGTQRRYIMCSSNPANRQNRQHWSESNQSCDEFHDIRSI